MPLGSRRFAASLLTALLLAALLLAAAASAATADPVRPPADDPFYQPPAGFEQARPGTVLRTRPVTVTGLGVPVPVHATQALFRSTDATGDPVAVVTTLMVPLTGYPGTRPLVSYQQAIDSLGDQCDPSYTLRTGTAYELPLMSQALGRGWAVTTTDFEGPRNAYGAGPMAGHAVLDGIRAATRLLGEQGTPVGMWGYSGGGQATAWAAELQPSYAPELRLQGVAAGGVPADLAAAGRQLDGGPFAGLFLAAAVGVGREYPEILHVLNDEGRALVNRIGDMCVAEEAATLAFQRLDHYTTMPNPLADPVVARVLQANDLGKVTPAAPTYLYHSVFDELIPYASARRLRDTYCAHGGSVQFVPDYLSEHNVLAGTGAPGAVRFLADRFAGRPAPSNC
jgi:secretory lipase